MEIPAYRDVNLLDVEETTSLGQSGEACISFELRPEKDLRMCSLDEHEPYVKSFSRLLDNLPIGYGMLLEAEIDNQKGMGPRPAISNQENSSVLHLINEERSRLFDGRERVVRYFAHVWSGCISPLKLPLLPSLISKRKNNSISEMDRSRSFLEDVSKSIIASLKSLQVDVKRLGKNEILKRYWEIFNPLKKDVFPKNFSDSDSLRSQLVASNSKEDVGSFYLDGFYHSVLTFYNYPEEMSLGSVDEFLDSLPFGSRYVTGILVPDQEQLLDSLKKKHRSASGLINEASSKDFESEARYGDIDEIITRCRQDGEKLYMAWSGVVLKHQDLNTLMELKKSVLFSIREIFGVTGVSEDFIHRRSFMATLPMGAHLSPRRNSMLGSTVSALAPLSHAWRGTKEGMTLSSQTKETLKFDLFDGGSPRHGIIVATTGGGKSFAANLMILSSLSDSNVRAMVIDSGHSYRRACEILGGAYFDMRIDERFAVNPLLPKKSLLREDGELDKESLGAQVSLLLRISQNTTGPGRFVMEKVLQGVYEKKDEPILSDLTNALKITKWDERLKPAAEAILSELLPFAEGIYSVLLSRPSKVRAFQTPLTVFELSGLKEHPTLQSVLVSVIQFSLARQLEDKSIRKVIFIDEGWKFFKDANAQELIESSYREMRKYNGAIISISQSPSEFLESPIAPAIMSNIHWVMALKMASGHDKLKSFGFSDQAIEKAKQLQVVPRSFAEVLIRFGQEPARVARIAPTSLQYWIATTNADEAVAEQKLREKENLSAIDSVRSMAKKEPVLSW